MKRATDKFYLDSRARVVIISSSSSLSAGRR